MIARIAGLGRALPARVVTSAELEERLGLPPGWVESRNGVRERRWASGETAVQLAATAAREALAEAGLVPEDLDLVLNCSGTQPQPIPDGAPLIQRELGLSATGVAALSVHATCLGFLAGLDHAAALLSAGRYRCILLVASDIASAALDFEDPESATLLGDGAAAVVLVPARRGEMSRLHAVRFETWPEGAALAQISGCGTARPPSHPEFGPEDAVFRMQGRDVLRLARRHLPAFLERLEPGLTSGLGSIDVVVPHQASRVGLRLLESFGWPAERIARTLETLGNCVAASVPLTLHAAVRAGQLARGQRVLLLGTGAGMSIGAVILTY